MWKELRAWLRFEDRPGAFELLETEEGAPSFWGGWPQEREEDEAADAEEIPRSVRACEARVRREFRCDINPDVVLRPFQLGGRIPALCVYMNGMADGDAVNDFILRDGMRAMPQAVDALARYAVENMFTMAEAATQSDWGKARTAILNGKSVVFLEGETHCVVMDTRGFEHRNVGTAQDEKVVRGPKESFSENLRTNITLLRRQIRREDLVCEIRDAGGGNHISAAILYREGTANARLVEEVKRRLARVKADVIINIGILEQLTESRRISIFPQLLATERPDRAANFLMQGHVVVLLDGSPFANVMPITLWALMASAEDAYLREPQGGLIRAIRALGAVLSVLLPGYFLALTLYHQDLLSTEVLNTIVLSRRMVFASMSVELIFLLLVFQLIREAGLRVPGGIGQAVGIIGGLIMGQAAISANLASAVMLIVVALSGLGNFCVPDYAMQLAASYLRILFVVAAWLGGFLGISAAFIMLTAYAASLKSYGVPYLTPFAPKTYAKHLLAHAQPAAAHARTKDFINLRRKKA